SSGRTRRSTGGCTAAGRRGRRRSVARPRQRQTRPTKGMGPGSSRSARSRSPCRTSVPTVEDSSPPGALRTGVGAMNARTAVLGALVVVCGWVAAADAELVACLGDSITYGSGIADRTNDSYPAQLQRILRQYDPAWEVRNF